MIRLGRRTSLLVAFYMLTSSATAHAECAWVLWTRVTEMETGKQERTSLNPTSALASKAECDAALGEQVSGAAVLARKLYGFEKVTTTETVVTGSGDGRGVSWLFRCLPDTIDPRGPKTKMNDTDAHRHDHRPHCGMSGNATAPVWKATR